jgi:hypothetical protein
LPINDQNQEERSRYVALEACEYLVMTTPACLLEVVPSSTRRGDEGRVVDEECLKSLSPLQERVVHREEGEFIPLVCEEVIDPGRSSSSLGRAYAIPYLSSQSNRFMHYCLYTKTMHSRALPLLEQTTASVTPRMIRYVR